MTGLTTGEINEELQARIDAIQAKAAAEAAEQERLANLECGIVLQAYDCSWNRYLDANPAMKAWSEKFPDMAEKERIRQGAVLD